MPDLDVSLGNMYDLNKDFVKQLRPMNDLEIASMYEKVSNWMQENKYYTLMCREKYDFTVFNLNGQGIMLTSDPPKPAYLIAEDTKKRAVKEIFDIAFDRGKIIEVCQDERGTAYEFWLLIGDEVFLYLLFPYDKGVIEVN